MSQSPVDSAVDKETICLWFARPNHIFRASDIQSYASLLSEDELARWESFRFDRHRCEFLTTRFLVRTALSHYYPTAPEAWRFQVNPFGKPSTDPDCGLRFNLSHTPSLAACLITNRGEVGVDIESYERARAIVAIAPEVLSELEHAQLNALSDNQKLDRALSLWTLKEAYVKARGIGISVPLKKISFRFGGEKGLQLELDPCLDDVAERWRYCLLEFAGHRVALMAELTQDPVLEVLVARPMPRPPRRLAGDGGRWFPNSEGSPLALRQQ